jgi:hypothetical protein
VWLRCPGCIHECGRHHEWEAQIFHLTAYGDRTVCPYCISKNNKFCPCRSVGSDPRLSKEWHHSNPPASEVAKCSGKQVFWICSEGHPPYKASCNSRCTRNTGCPACGLKKTRHPVLSVGRPDLAKEWDRNRNSKLASEVTLGSNVKAWWVCSSNPEHPGWQTGVHNRALAGNGCPVCACQASNRFKRRQFGSSVN